MIDKIVINNFKCFKNISLELSNINLLAGVNSGGKSSAIQALLLLSQNITTNNVSTLNGHLVSIGDFSEARNYITNAREFEISAIKNNDKVAISFREENEICISEKKALNDNIENNLNYLKHKIHYLSANRIGVKDLYDKNLNQIDKFGVLGEYAIDYLEKNKQNSLNESLVINKDSNTLIAQVNYWLQYILNTEISTENISGTDRVKAQYSNMPLRKNRPLNIGSGISYIISLLIVCLSSQKNDLIILENPEIHLHPKAQSRLTDFFVFIANYGIQLIIESHSDHIFNGLRKNVNKKLINKDLVSIYFFNLVDNLSNPIKIELNDLGQVKNHQEGLFDQFDDDLNELLGL